MGLNIESGLQLLCPIQNLSNDPTLCTNTNSTKKLTARKLTAVLQAYRKMVVTWLNDIVPQCHNPPFKDFFLHPIQVLHSSFTWIFMMQTQSAQKPVHWS